MEGLVVADNFEKQLEKFYKQGASSRAMLLDFSQATFIEVATLSICIATLVQRADDGYTTFIGMPASKLVRNFLQVWRFIEAVQDAIHVDPAEIIIADDIGYLDEQQDSYTGRGDAVSKLEFDPDWSPQKKSARNFFEFATISENGRSGISPGGRLASAPKEEGRKWTRPLILEVLKKHLPGETTRDEVARVVIYESISNAVRHPDARIIQVVSKLHLPAVRSSNPSGSLRICVWDDGLSIVKTLQAASKAGQSLRAFELPTYMCDNLLVTIRNFDKTWSKEHVIAQSYNPKADDSEARLLVSSLFPGVTRTVGRLVEKVAPFEDAASASGAMEMINSLGSAPGMGLYALMRTVIDQFKGVLLIRSGAYRLIIEAAHDKPRVQHGVRYKCKITQYPEYFPGFRGNLLTVQLPLG